MLPWVEGPYSEPMKIVLHAGLHKSGTTSVQMYWREAFRQGGAVWYPGEGNRLPGHHSAIWPLMECFRGTEHADLVWARSLYRGRARLAEWVQSAEATGVEVLLVSTEELDRFGTADVSRFTDVLAGHDVTTLVTVTRPLHRWCSGWQTLVKHGLSQYPREASRHVLAYGSLGVGRLEQLVTQIPAQRRVIRVVRTSPHEESLPQDLAELVDVHCPQDVHTLTARNTSIGSDVEILRRINRADMSMGTVYGQGRKFLRSLDRQDLQYVEKPELAAMYEPPGEFWKAAEAERDFLCGGAAAVDVEVVDPHGEAEHWLNDQPASWYAEISRREAVLPELDDPTDESELLWRVRQERSALEARLGRAEKRAAAADDLEKRLKRQQRKLKALELSTSWRVTRPLRRVARLLSRG